MTIKESLQMLWEGIKGTFTWESVIFIVGFSVMMAALAGYLAYKDQKNREKQPTPPRVYTRADIIHAFTSGHMDGRSGITHSDALQGYKERENL
jgi:hypothetical protein